MKASDARAESSQSLRPKTRAAWAMPRIMRAFHEVRIFSSRPGRTRVSRSFEELGARRIEDPAGCGVLDRSRDDQVPRVALEVGRPVEAEGGHGDREFLRREVRADFLDAPDVVAAFLAFGIGIERGVVAAVGRLHLAHHPRAGLFADAREERIAA